MGELKFSKEKLAKILQEILEPLQFPSTIDAETFKTKLAERVGSYNPQTLNQYVAAFRIAGVLHSDGRSTYVPNYQRMRQILEEAGEEKEVSEK